MKVIDADGRVIQLMTKDAGFFGRWFTICRDYRQEGWKLMTLQGRWRYSGSLVSDPADDVRSSG
jgi:hypothetical protein